MKTIRVYSAALLISLVCGCDRVERTTTILTGTGCGFFGAACGPPPPEPEGWFDFLGRAIAP